VPGPLAVIVTVEEPTGVVSKVATVRVVVLALLPFGVTGAALQVTPEGPLQLMVT
jgi:hypothetical protein